MALQVGELFAALEVDSKLYDKGLDQAEKDLKTTGRKMDRESKTIGQKIGRGISEGMRSSLKNMGANMTKWVTAPLIAGYFAVTKGTKEFRSDLGRLEANAKIAGQSMAGLHEHMATLNAITGETDSNVEGLSNLLATGFKDQKLSELLESLYGASIKFSDTLKFEGIADGLQETLATGKAIGPFGELLERSGVNLDQFNAGLAKAKKKGQEQNYILEQLAKTGLKDTWVEYEKLNKQMIEAERANYKLEVGFAKLGATLEPILTPIIEGLSGMLTKFNDLPGPVKKTILIALGLVIVLGPLFMGLSSVLTVLSSLGVALPVIGGFFAALAGPVGIAIAIFAALVVGGILLIKNWDKIKAFGVRMWDSITTAWHNAWVYLKAGMQDVGTAYINIWSQIIGKILEAIAAGLRFVGAVDKAAAVQLEADTMNYRPLGLALEKQSGRRNGLGFGGYAMGTSFHPGGLSWVGERGPELVNLPRGAQVLNNSQSIALANKQSVDHSGVVYHVFQTNDKQVVAKIAQEFERGNRRIPSRVATMPSMA